MHVCKREGHKVTHFLLNPRCLILALISIVANDLRDLQQLPPAQCSYDEHFSNMMVSTWDQFQTL